MHAPADDVLLRVEGLTIEYPARRGRAVAVHEATLEIRRGEIIAIVGESGSGKSSIANAILRLLAPGARMTSGSIAFDGTDIVGLPERRMREIRGGRIGYIPQDPLTNLDPLRRAGSPVAEVLREHAPSGEESDTTDPVSDLLARAGLETPARIARRFPHELSGGQRQRVLIAAAIASRPELLVADEFTASLDTLTQRRLLRDVRTLVEHERLSMLLITHDLTVAAAAADRVYVMREGRVVESGPAEEVLDHPADPYTRDLVHAARPRLAPAVIAARSSAPAVLEATGLVKAYRRDGETLRVVDDVSFSLTPGSALALVGGSGSGKSTTALLTLGLAGPDAGHVAYSGRRLDTYGRLELRRGVQAVFQASSGALDLRYTAVQAVAEALRIHRRWTSSSLDRIVGLLDRVGLPEAAAMRRLRSLSGGQLQRVAIARALVLEPEVLVLDEPVSALDPLIRQSVLELLAEFKRERGTSYLYITHDLETVPVLADDVAVMSAGRIVEQGPVHRVFRAPTSAIARELLEAGGIDVRREPEPPGRA